MNSLLDRFCKGLVLPLDTALTDQLLPSNAPLGIVCNECGQAAHQSLQEYVDVCLNKSVSDSSHQQIVWLSTKETKNYKYSQSWLGDKVVFLIRNDPSAMQYRAQMEQHLLQYASSPSRMALNEIIQAMFHSSPVTPVSLSLVSLTFLCFCLWPRLFKRFPLRPATIFSLIEEKSNENEKYLIRFDKENQILTISLKMEKNVKFNEITLKPSSSLAIVYDLDGSESSRKKHSLEDRSNSPDLLEMVEKSRKSAKTAKKTVKISRSYCHVDCQTESELEKVIKKFPQFSLFHAILKDFAKIKVLPKDRNLAMHPKPCYYLIDLLRARDTSRDDPVLDLTAKLSKQKQIQFTQPLKKELNVALTALRICGEIGGFYFWENTIHAEQSVVALPVVSLPDLDEMARRFLRKDDKNENGFVAVQDENESDSIDQIEEKNASLHSIHAIYGLSLSRDILLFEI